jgi:hypothetical protein
MGYFDLAPCRKAAIGCWGGLDEAAAGTKVNRIANEQESTKALKAIRCQFWREIRGVLGSYPRDVTAKVALRERPFLGVRGVEDF